MKTVTLFLLASVLGFSTSSAAAQTPSSPPTPTYSSSGSASPSTPSTVPAKPKGKPIPSFLIVGTVFDEHALSFPGVQVRVRQAGEKKFQWKTYTNSRGEFAVRVPPGPEYEVWIHMKNYGDQRQPVHSKVDVQQRLSVKLEPAGQTQKEAKP